MRITSYYDKDEEQLHLIADDANGFLERNVFTGKTAYEEAGEIQFSITDLEEGLEYLSPNPACNNMNSCKQESNMLNDFYENTSYAIGLRTDNYHIVMMLLSLINERNRFGINRIILGKAAPQMTLIFSPDGLLEEFNELYGDLILGLNFGFDFKVVLQYDEEPQKGDIMLYRKPSEYRWQNPVPDPSDFIEIIDSVDYIAPGFWGVETENGEWTCKRLSACDYFFSGRKVWAVVPNDQLYEYYTEDWAERRYNENLGNNVGHYSSPFDEIETINTEIEEDNEV